MDLFPAMTVVDVQDVFVNNAALKALLTLGIRFSNTYAGGLQWMWYASKIGLQ